MAHEQLSSLSPRAQEQYLKILLGTLAPGVREAALEVAQWLASEHPGGEHVTPTQVLQWIEDVRIRNAQRSRPASALILPFGRKP